MPKIITSITYKTYFELVESFAKRANTEYREATWFERLIGSPSFVFVDQIEKGWTVYDGGWIIPMWLAELEWQLDPAVRED